jgi:TRAP-type transport system periplasmic protein
LGSGGAPTARASFIVTAQSVFDPTTLIKLSVATLNDANHEWMKRFAALIKKNSDGRMKAEIYPASQLTSSPRQIEGAQLGSIQIVLGA